MISTRLVELVIDTVVCLTLAKWETVSGQFGGYLKSDMATLQKTKVAAHICVGSLLVSSSAPLKPTCGKE